MTGRQHRPPGSDRARRRAIRAHAARHGVPYSVAARLLAGAAGRPGDPDDHRAWLFAFREQRSFDLRVRDTRLAADLPLGRAGHLAERFPVLRRSAAGPFYDGEARPAALGMLYAVLMHESPALRPADGELAWVAELGEETAVDMVCAGADHAARRLLDIDRWQLCTRIEAALDVGLASPDRRVRDPAITLDREFRTTVIRRSLDGARHTLDALLVAAHDGYAPGTRVRIVSDPRDDRPATVVAVGWSATGAPDTYRIQLDEGDGTLTVAIDAVAAIDEPTRPQPVRP